MRHHHWIPVKVAAFANIFVVEITCLYSTRISTPSSGQWTDIFVSDDTLKKVVFLLFIWWNGQHPKSQLFKKWTCQKCNRSFMVILCLDWLLGKLTFWRLFISLRIIFKILTVVLICNFRVDMKVSTSARPKLWVKVRISRWLIEVRRRRNIRRDFKSRWTSLRTS